MKWHPFSKYLVSLSLMAAIYLPFVIVYHPKAEAISGSDWQAGRIIDDTVFFNSGSMNAADIQNFLNAKVPVCDTNGTQPYGNTGMTRAEWAAANGRPLPPYICLKDYLQNIPGKAADSYCGPIGAGVKSASNIIREIAAACNINPQSLLVLLQKEQSLVTDDWPWPVQYEKATGYACPDTATCDPEFAGFFNQIYYAARQFQRYSKQSNLFNYQAAQTSFVAYNPKSSCGGSNVFIQNQATAGLYNYTPYQPNQAALNNLYGMGDACSTYGNRNFWRMFNEWFGSTYSNETFGRHPDGTLISMNHAVFLMDNGARRHIRSPSIFESYGYKWSEVKPATLGDLSTPEIYPVDIFRPGTLFRTPSSSVYTMVYEAPYWKKQLITYKAFIALGYKWEEVLVIPEAELPQPTASSVLIDNQHPHGTFIRAPGDSRVYVIEHGTRRYVPLPEVLYSYNKWWTDIKTATTLDNQLPIGADMPFREGTLLYDGANLFVTDLPTSGPEKKRPITPWECFADRLKFSLRETYRLPNSSLPTENGPIVYC
jgi:hypothetical protein